MENYWWPCKKITRFFFTEQAFACSDWGIHAWGGKKGFKKYKFIFLCSKSDVARSGCRYRYYTIVWHRMNHRPWFISSEGMKITATSKAMQHLYNTKKTRMYLKTQQLQKKTDPDIDKVIDFPPRLDCWSNCFGPAWNQQSNFIIYLLLLLLWCIQ